MRVSRPTMKANIPDLTVYAPCYVITAEVETAKGFVTITEKLRQDDEYFCTWKYIEDELTGRRGEHTLKRGTATWYLLNNAQAHLRAEAITVARATGWYIDPLSSLWFAPMSVWKGTLNQIIKGGW